MAEPGALRSLPANRIAAFIADAAERWCDADFAPRVRATAAIEARLGYTTPVVDYALDRLFAGVTRDALEAAVASELGSVAALDGIVERRGSPAAWARGVDRVVVVSSDSTIGVAIVPALFALCAKCDVVVKDRGDALVAAFFSSLADEHPAFARAALARAWEGGDDPAEDALLGGADVVVAFGRDETLRTIRARCGVDTRFVPFGHRASAGRLTRGDVSALDDALAERIARDAILYDGEGCLSLHALFVEAEGDALARVADTLAAAIERATVEFPGGERSPQRVAAVAAYRNLAAFRASGGRGAVFRAGDATLAVDPPHDDGPPLLPRVLPLIAVDGDDAIVAYAERHRLPLQALGVVQADERAVALAERLGAVRVAPFGSMQAPPLGGHHGGAPRIADFVRWIDRE
ncbi:MAG: acyl-CoA reductase [Candidatus Eremiobacteraeota bacterium]|nr:acyl-CoA reductase [Candidatus Eremiobacteraeota bacterium]